MRMVGYSLDMGAGTIKNGSCHALRRGGVGVKQPDELILPASAGAFPLKGTPWSSKAFFPCYADKHI